MIPSYTSEEFSQARSRTKLSLRCEHCNKPFSAPKNVIQRALIETDRRRLCYCSTGCAYLGHRKERHVFSCAQCGKTVIRTNGDLTSRRNRKAVNHFCSRRCSGIYHAAHKIKGDRRSKLEYWLEEQLHLRYPSIELHFNQRDTIQAELDIYIPLLKLAFELNGIFHYEPIFGQNKLDQTQSKDHYKLHACTEAKIDLCVIDVSTARYFKPASSQRFLDIITKIIDDRLK